MERVQGVGLEPACNFCRCRFFLLVANAQVKILTAEVGGDFHVNNTSIRVSSFRDIGEIRSKEGHFDKDRKFKTRLKRSRVSVFQLGHSD